MTSRFAGVTRWFLYLLIASIAVGAMLAIVIVLGGTWGYFESRVLMTTGAIALASVLGMACAAASSRSGSPLPFVGVGLAALTGVLLIVGIWTPNPGDLFWRVTASIGVLAGASAWASVASLARLTPGHRWSQWLAGATVFAFAAIVVGIIFLEPQADTVYRGLAVVGILTAAFGLLVPVFHFLDRHAFAAPATATAEPMPANTVEAIDAELAELRAQVADLEARRAELSADG